MNISIPMICEFEFPLSSYGMSILTCRFFVWIISATLISTPLFKTNYIELILEILENETYIYSLSKIWYKFEFWVYPSSIYVNSNAF